jgi:hypothetical protein
MAGREACVLRPDWPDLPAGVGALATTRKGGVSAAPWDDGAGGGGLNLGRHVDDAPEAVQENRARLRALLPGEPAWIAQVHGAAVVDASLVRPGAPVQTGDASIAAGAGIVCAILTADCLPVLFADLDGKVVGAAHAGWRGLAGVGSDRPSVRMLSKSGATCATPSRRRCRARPPTPSATIPGARANTWQTSICWRGACWHAMASPAYTGASAAPTAKPPSSIPTGATASPAVRRA